MHFFSWIKRSLLFCTYVCTCIHLCSSCLANLHVDEIGAWSEGSTFWFCTYFWEKILVIYIYQNAVIQAQKYTYIHCFKSPVF
jgi:hypothetical protein